MHGGFLERTGALCPEKMLPRKAIPGSLLFMLKGVYFSGYAWKDVMQILNAGAM